MPTYFFHVDDGDLRPDHEGTELSSDDKARSAAVTSAGEVLSDFDGEFWSNGQHWTLHVTDERKRLLFSLHLSAEAPSRHPFVNVVKAENLMIDDAVD